VALFAFSSYFDRRACARLTRHESSNSFKLTGPSTEPEKSNLKKPGMTSHGVPHTRDCYTGLLHGIEVSYSNYQPPREIEHLLALKPTALEKRGWSRLEIDAGGQFLVPSLRPAEGPPMQPSELSGPAMDLDGPSTEKRNAS
jgi:hypothetical protein